jgi:rhodanese-related sulfurtransferase
MGQRFFRTFSSLNVMPEVGAAEAKQIIDSGAQLIDVRTDVEFEAGHIPGARHVPLADIQTEAAGLEKTKPVLLYCRSGNRSGPAADAFAASGWDAHSVEGGLIAWSESGLELEPEGGSVAENPNMPPR